MQVTQWGWLANPHPHLMLPIIIIADLVIWYTVGKVHKKDLQDFSEKEKETKVTTWPEGSAPLQPSGIFSQDRDEDRLIMRDFEMWLERENQKDPTLEEYLWQEGLINPVETVWCNGTPLQPGYPEDMELFESIKERANLEGLYNSKLLEEGGSYELKRDELMLRGASLEGANQLLIQGVIPEEFPSLV